MRADEDVNAYVDGYMRLAEAIIEYAAVEYSYLFPTTAKSQAEFTLLDDIKGFKAEREYILRSLCRSAVRRVVDYDICKSAFDKRRYEEMKKLGITYK